MIKYFDKKELTNAGKEALINLLELESPEELDALESEKSEDLQKFTNEELESKIGLFLRIFRKYHIEENIREHRFSRFSAWLNKVYDNGCSRDELIAYFNLASDKVLKSIDLI